MHLKGKKSCHPTEHYTKHEYIGKNKPAQKLLIFRDFPPKVPL